jgi:hypothetical protein
MTIPPPPIPSSPLPDTQPSCSASAPVLREQLPRVTSARWEGGSSWLLLEIPECTVTLSKMFIHDYSVKIAELMENIEYIYILIHEWVISQSVHFPETCSYFFYTLMLNIMQISHVVDQLYL